jgi:hypothetical protein
MDVPKELDGRRDTREELPRRFGIEPGGDPAIREPATVGNEEER